MFKALLSNESVGAKINAKHFLTLMFQFHHSKILYTEFWRLFYSQGLFHKAAATKTDVCRIILCFGVFHNDTVVTDQEKPYSHNDNWFYLKF